MAFFYTRKEAGDTVVYTPIGKRAAILGYGWFFVVGAAVWVYQDHFLSFYAFSFLLFASVMLIFWPMVICWVDGLPDWFPPSLSRDGWKIFRLSWEGKETVVTKKDLALYGSVPKGPWWWYPFFALFAVVLGYVMWYFFIVRP